MEDSQGLIKAEDFENWKKQIIPEHFVQPETNIYVANDQFVVVVNFPGVPRENIRIEISNNELILFGKIPSSFEFAGCDFYIKEFRLGNYYRKFYLSENIDIDNIAAKCENGQLTLILPRRKKHERHEIVIT